MTKRRLILVLLGILLGLGLAPRDSGWLPPGTYTEHFSGLGPSPADGPGPGQVRWDSLLVSFYIDFDLDNWNVSVPGCCEEPSLAGWRSFEATRLGTVPDGNGVLHDRGLFVAITRPARCSPPEFCRNDIRWWIVGYDSGLPAPYGPWIGLR